MSEKFNNLIDPHKNSVIPEKLILDFEKPGHADQYRDRETGEIFFWKHNPEGIEKNDLKKEHFVALLVKGIFHSSDMFRTENNEYFSRKINLENTEAGKQFEKEAEIFLLNFVIGDFDRKVSMSYDLHNIQEDEDGKFAHFDFAESFSGHTFKDMHRKSGYAREMFNHFCKVNNFSDTNRYNFSLQIVSKLDMLEQTIKDKTFILAILKKSGFEPPEEVIKASKTKMTIKKIEKYFNPTKEKITGEDINFSRVQGLILKPLHSMKKIAENELKRKI